MPRTSFSMEAATPGLSKLAAAIAGGGAAERKAFDDETMTQTKMAAALAQMGAHRAAAAKDEAQTSMLTGRPDVFEEQVAANAGSSIPLVRAVRDLIKTGAMPADPSRQIGPPTAEGQMGLGSMQIPPEAESKIRQALNAFAPVLTNANGIDADNIAKAAGVYRTQGREDQALAGGFAPGQLENLRQLKLSEGGKDRFGANAEGVLDQFSGRLDTSAPTTQATIGQRRAAAGASTAAAANSYASAGQHKAQTSKINDEIALGKKGVLRDTDQGLVSINPWTNEVTPVNGSDGQQLGAKLKQVPAAANKAIIENDQNLNKVDQALALLRGESVGALQGDTKATGAKGFLPNSLLNRMDPKGVDTRAMISDIGSLVLHDRSGAAVSASESPRLMPFIPLASDDPVTAMKKLTRFKQVYEQEQEALNMTYSREQGYNPNPLSDPKRRATDKAQAQAAPPAAHAQGGSAPQANRNIRVNF